MRIWAISLVVLFGMIPSPGYAEERSREEAAGSKPALAIRKTQLTLNREEIHVWNRYIRSFRRDHNFAVSSGVGTGLWQVNSFGTLESEKVQSKGAFTKFQYSFHLPIYRGFGYILGSSIGYLFENTDSEATFRSSPAIMFPGVLAGLVYNISPVVRFSSALEAYLERVNGLADEDKVGDDPKIAITMEALDLGTFLDVFYVINWGVRIEAHWRQSTYLRPVRPEGKPVDANIKKADRWAGVGLVYHFL